MDYEQSGTDLRWILTVIRRWWVLILGCTLLAGTVAFAVSSLREPQYEASSTLLVQPTKDSGTSEYTLLVAGELLAITYSEIVTGQPVLEAVISQSDLEMTPDELAGRIKAEPIRDTQLIRLTVTASSPEQAVLLANTLAETFIAQVRELNVDRYNAYQESRQAKLEALSANMVETRSSIDALNTQKIDVDVEQARLERQLENYRSDFREQQLDYQALQSSLNQLMNDMTIVETAILPDSEVASPYTATVTLLFSDQAFIQTYEQVLLGRPVLEAAIAELDLEISPDDLAEQVTVSPVRNTQLIRLSVKNSDAALATNLANSMAAAFIEQVQAIKAEPFENSLLAIQENMESLSDRIDQTEAEVSEATSDKIRVDTEITLLENLLSEQRTDYQLIQQDLEQLDLTAANEGDSIVVVEPAQTPLNPVQNRLLYTFLAAAVGAMVAIGTAFLLEFLNDTIKTTEDVRRIAGVNLLGTIGRFSNGENEMVVFAEPRSEMAESFRVLATNLRFASVDQPLRTLLVTSPHSKEGKSFVAANLAAALAQKELRVVLVDADLRLPRLHELFGFHRSKGLSNALLSGNIDGNLQPTQVVHLRVLSGGHTPPNPTELVSSSRMRKMLAELSQEADLVVIDSPPVLPVADAATLAASVDGVLLVLRAGQTRGQAARQALERLRQVQANVLGVVLNGMPTRGDGYYHYRYHEDDRSLEKDWEETTLKARLEQIFTKLTQKFNLPR